MYVKIAYNIFSLLCLFNIAFCDQLFPENRIKIGLFLETTIYNFDTNNYFNFFFFYLKF